MDCITEESWKALSSCSCLLELTIFIFDDIGEDSALWKALTETLSANQTHSVHFGQLWREGHEK